MRLAARLMSAILMAALILPSLVAAPVAASGLTTHLEIVGLNATETAGVNDTITVNALDAGNAVDTTFAGTISFTSTDLAVLPANGSTLTSGTADFVVQFHFAGPQSLTVTEDGDTPTDTANTTVNPAAATHFTVSGFTNPVVAGVSGGVDVAAIDAFNNVDTNYAGTIHFTSSDPLATLPADATTVNGQASFAGMVLRTAGTQSITGTDTVTPSITGSQVGIDVTPAAATHLSVTGYPSPTTAGVAHNVTVTARDTFENVATGYVGTVHLTSSDGAATLPANHTYTGGENGVHAFSVTLNTVGAGRSITATDTVTGSITGSQAGITVSAVPNNAPVAVADAVTVASGSGYVPLDLLTNDNAANPDIGETLLITLASNPPHGAVTITGGGTGLSYRPDAGYIGSDSFTYTISDGLLTDSATVTVSVPKDTFKPVATAPVQRITGQAMGTSTVKVHLTWGGTDLGSGISKFEVWQSTDGHSFTKIRTSTGHSMSPTVTVNHTYRFRVRAIDKAGNIGAFAYGPTFKFVRYQETSWSYSGTWTSASSTSFSGGHVRRTTSAGAAAAIHTTGRTFTWVGVRGPSRGTADVFVDGVLKAHLNLNATSTTYRYVNYSITFASSGAHTLQVVYTGPTSRRIDVDAFLVLR